MTSSGDIKSPITVRQLEVSSATDCLHNICKVFTATSKSGRIN